MAVAAATHQRIRLGGAHFLIGLLEGRDRSRPSRRPVPFQQTTENPRVREGSFHRKKHVHRTGLARCTKWPHRSLAKNKALTSGSRLLRLSWKALKTHEARTGRMLPGRMLASHPAKPNADSLNSTLTSHLAFPNAKAGFGALKLVPPPTPSKPRGHRPPSEP